MQPRAVRATDNTLLDLMLVSLIPAEAGIQPECNAFEQNPFVPAFRLRALRFGATKPRHSWPSERRRVAGTNGSAKLSRG
jgi:hypothetical protein